jgi:hypothetical protein
MKIAITPLVVAALFVSFFIRGEILVASRAEHGYLFADLAFVFCFAVLFASIFIVLFIMKYDPKKLLRVKASKERILELVAFCLVLISYVFLTVRFGGEIVTGRFAILLAPIPLLAVLYLLELRWVRDV